MAVSAGNTIKASEVVPLAGGVSITGNLEILKTDAAFGIANASRRITIYSDNSKDSNRGIWNNTDKKHTILITSAGVQTFYGTANGSSSKLIKENINPITKTEALKVLQLNPVYFKYKEGFEDSDYHYGLIAEEVLPLIPSVVSEKENYYRELPKNKEDITYTRILHLNYAGFIPHLIKMVQIQQEEINELKSRIMVLERTQNE